MLYYSILFMTSLALLMTLAASMLLLSKIIRAVPCSNSQKCFSDLVDYALLGPLDILILKDGSLMKCYEVCPKSNRYLNTESLLQFHESLKNSIRKISADYILNFDLIRHEEKKDCDTTYFGQENGKKLFLSRLRTNCTFKTRAYLSITKKNTGLYAQDLLSLLNDDSPVKNNTVKILEEFAVFSDEMIRGFTRQASVHPLTYTKEGSIRSTHESLNFLYECIYGKKRSLFYDHERVFLDMYLTGGDFESGTCPKLNDEYIGIVAIDALPKCTSPNVLNFLGSLPFNIRFSSRYIGFSKMESGLKLEFYKRLWVQRRRSFLAQILGNPDDKKDSDAEEMLHSIEEAKKGSLQGELTFGSYTALIVVRDRLLDPLEKKLQYIMQKLEDLGFLGRIENYNATEAFLGSLPGHYHENLRRAMVADEIVADLLPLDVPFSGENCSPNPFYGKNAPPLMYVKNQDGDLCTFNLHTHDNGNTLVVGPPGGGKSVFLGALITSLLRYEDMQVFAFDKGGSFMAQCLALDGTLINLEGDSISLCPLENLDDEISLGRAFNFILSLFAEINHPLSSADKNNLMETLKIMRDTRSIHRTLSEYIRILNSEKLMEALSIFTREQNVTSLLDGEHNPILDKKLCVFECERFFEDRNHLIYPTLRLIFSLIENEIMMHKSAAIIIDEAWLMLKDECFSKELIKWIKTLRKFNTPVILATQSLNDLSKSSILPDVLDCVKTRVYLPNADVKSESLQSLYTRMGLNEKAQEEIFMGLQKHDLFLQKNGIFMPFSLMLSEWELKLLSTTMRDRERILKLYHTYQRGFIWKL